MPTETQSATLGDLERLKNALTANASDFEHILGALTEFQTLMGQAQDAATQQAILISAKQEATKRFQTLLREARLQGSLLREAARVRYGRSSDKLAQFGVQPFRGRKTAPTPPSIEPENPTPPTIE